MGGSGTTYNSAYIGGFYTAGIDSVLAFGFEWTDDTTATVWHRIYINPLPASQELVTFQLDKLKPNTYYCVRSFVTTTAGDYFDEEPECFQTYDFNGTIVYTDSVSIENENDLNYSTQMYASVFIGNDVQGFTNFGFFLKQNNQNWSNAQTISGTGTTITTFMANVTDLKKDTLYCIKAFVETPDGTIYEDSDSIEFIVNGYNGLIELLSNKVSVLLYPNPATTEINFVCSEIINEIEIFNLLGQRVYFSNAGNKNATINVTYLAKGNYVAKITTNKGISTNKIVIE